MQTLEELATAARLSLSEIKSILDAEMARRNTQLQRSRGLPMKDRFAGEY